VYAKVILEYMNYDSIVIVRKHRTRVHTDYARSHAMAHGQTSYRLDIRRKRPVLLLGRGAAVHAGTTDDRSIARLEREKGEQNGQTDRQIETDTDKDRWGYW